MESASPSSNFSIFESKDLFTGFVDQRSWEPGWLADYRMDRWNAFSSKGSPALKDETWRFSPQSRFSLSGVKEISSDKKQLQLSKHHEGHFTFGELDKVILDSPSEISSLIECQGPDLGAKNIYHLASAFFECGFLLKTRSEIQNSEPFTIRHRLPENQSISFRKNFISLAPNSHVRVVEFIEGTNHNSKNFLGNVLHAHVGEGASLERILIQDAGSSSTVFQLDNFSVGKNGSLRNICIHLGSSQCRNEIKGQLIDEGAEFDNFSLFLGTGEQLLDQRTMQLHLAPNCRSNLISKNALSGESKSIFSGMIKVLPGAMNTNSYQTNRNLLLSNEAEADSMPGLEILANEVKCSHGATTSKIDDQELFYLLSRGIPQKSAEKLISLGFLEEIISEINDEKLIESIRARIESKFD